MTELDELRAANPVDPATLEVPDELRRRVLAGEQLAAPPRAFGRRPARRPRRLGVTRGRAGASDHRPRPWPGRAVVGAALLVAVLVAGVLTLGGGTDAGRPSLAGRAVAAFTGPGVVHWVTVTIGDAGGSQRAEGWSAGGIQHVVTTESGRDGRARLVADLRAGPRGTRTYLAGRREVMSGPPLAQQSVDVGFVPGVDPFAAFRVAYREHRLARRTATEYDVRRGPGRPGARRARTTYTLDPRTGRPTLLAFRALEAATYGRPAREHVIVVRFLVYERLPDTAANRAHLALLPRRSPAVIDAAAHFAALRTGPRPTARQLVVARALAGAGRPGGQPLRVEDARQTGDGGVLIPGATGLCLMVGGGGSCTSTAEALHRGLAISGSAVRGMVVVVPDRVRAVRARCGRRAPLTVAVRENAARLPNGGCRFTLVR